MPAASTMALGLLLELRQQTPRTIDRWRGPTARTASAISTGATYRLGARPVVRGKSGRWVRQGLTWTTLPHQLHRLQLDAIQQAWFAQFAGLHRSTRVTYLGQDADWLYLDEFLSPLLWPLLADAARLGITLVGSGDAVIQVGGSATISLDLAATADGGIRLQTVVEIDGHPYPPATTAAIGDHGIYSYASSTPPHITLARAAEPITDDQRRLLGRPESVGVPKRDVPEFMSGYYRRLLRGIVMTSADESVVLPEAAPPELVVTATHSPGDRLTLEFEWEYDLDGETVRLAVEPEETASGGRTGNDQGRERDRGPDEERDRDANTERATLQRLRAVPGVAVRSQTLVGLDAAEFSAGVLPAIGATDGVRVEVVGTAPDYRELTEKPHLTVTTHESDRTDWFDLGVTVTVEGHDVPFGPLFKALARGHKKLLLPDKSYLSLAQPVFDQLRELIDEAASLSEWETSPRISRYNADLWADFEDLADQSEVAVSWRRAAAGLRDATVEATALPRSLTAQLRPYQKQGYDWLAFLWRHRMGGILADDMGLGKTLQALALIAHAVEAHDASVIHENPDGARRPFLVVAPTSVVSNWAAEAAKFTPTLTIRTITATQAKSRVAVTESARGADIVVTSYALLRLDAAAYTAHEWAGAIFDEAQFVKNPASRAHEVALDLRAPFKLAITGTPLENSLTDLWSLFEITAPGLFPSLRRFTEEYVRPVGRGSNAKSRSDAGTVGVSGARADLEAQAYARQRIARLRKRIRPLMMRRTKENVAGDLPAKQEQQLRIELAPKHRRLYDTVLQRERRKVFGLIDDLDKNRFIVFRSLTLLRMLSLDASLVDENYADIPSSKLDALLEQLDDVVAEGHRALLFSQFTSYLGKVAQRLEAAGIDYVYLDGSTRRRASVIAGFKEGVAPVFLISLKAGGFGLNLTEADYVFLLDPWWNPAAETQAIDRTHRIGQTRNVMVYRMIAADTIEEKVMALGARKAALFDAVMDDDALFSRALTADDIRGLLD